jgi:hypothetical protein
MVNQVWNILVTQLEEETINIMLWDQNTVIKMLDGSLLILE